MNASPSRPGGVTPRTVQIGLGAVWLFDGLLQLQPKMFGSAFADQVVRPSAAGQPAWLGWPIDEMARLVAANPAAVNAVFAAVQILIGIGLLRRQTVRPALALSFAWAAGVWAFGEGFGMIFTGTASPLTGAPGAVLLYALIGLLVWPCRRAAPPGALAPVVGAGGGVASAAAAGPLGERGARLAWALVWLGMAVLWVTPANDGAGSVSSAITAAAGSSPAWLAHAQEWLASQLAGDGAVVASVLAVLSAVIAVGPLVARRATVFLVAGAALSLDFWVFGQSLGGLTSGIATDPNAGPLFVLLALALFPAADRARLGADVVRRPVASGTVRVARAAP